MACCPSTILNFAGVYSSIFPYTNVMKQAYGLDPRAEVYYFDVESGEFYTQNGNPITRVTFDGNFIYVDHGGGLESGYLKIS